MQRLPHRQRSFPVNELKQIVHYLPDYAEKIVPKQVFGADKCQFRAGSCFFRTGLRLRRASFIDRCRGIRIVLGDRTGPMETTCTSTISYISTAAGTARIAPADRSHQPVYTEQPVGYVPDADEADADSAVEAAHRAFRHGRQARSTSGLRC